MHMERGDFNYIRCGELCAKFAGCTHAFLTGVPRICYVLYPLYVLFTLKQEKIIVCVYVDCII